MELDWEVREYIYGKYKSFFEIWIDSSCVILKNILGLIVLLWNKMCFWAVCETFLICSRAYLVL